MSLREKPVHHYEITVWDITNGDIVHKEWDGSEEDLSWCEETYAGEPFFEIVIDREWEGSE